MREHRIMREHPPVEQPGASRPVMAWNAWGTPDRAHPLSPATSRLLQQALGCSASAAPAPDRIDLRPSALTDSTRAALVAVVGSAHVSTADDVRMRHLGGKSTLDLLARRRGGIQDAPDAVVFPANDSEIEALLRVCGDDAVAVVPFGGGTSVVGGVDPVREWFDAVVTIDLGRMSAMTALDPVSRTATFQAGVTGPDAEDMLARHGLSLGHFPQSFMFATLGGFAATRSSGQASAGYGRFSDMVESLTVVTPVGITTAGTAPASAAGPDLRQVFLGSEGAFGIVTSVTVRVHPIPESTSYRAWWFPDFDSGTAAFRTLAAETGRPTVMRLSDDAETAIGAALASGTRAETPPGGCLAVATFDGDAHSAEERADRADAVASHAGGTVLDPEFARQWEATRFDSPYLRDGLLDAGAVAETLETASSWTRLASVRSAVTTALTTSLTAAGTPPIVMSHISHVYATGASLYFTVVCAASDDPLAQWHAAKNAATTAIVEAGGTLTHHHAVGRDHRPWMFEEVGAVGTTILRAVKAALDPAGILNPGKLIP